MRTRANKFDHYDLPDQKIFALKNGPIYKERRAKTTSSKKEKQASVKAIAGRVDLVYSKLMRIKEEYKILRQRVEEANKAKMAQQIEPLWQAFDSMCEQFHVSNPLPQNRVYQVTNMDQFNNVPSYCVILAIVLREYGMDYEQLFELTKNVPFGFFKMAYFLVRNFVENESFSVLEEKLYNSLKDHETIGLAWTAADRAYSFKKWKNFLQCFR